MSEKRFKIYQDSIRKFESDRIWGVKSETNSLEPYMTFKEAEKCCDLLNEQQATIQSLQEQLQDYKEIKDNWDSMVAKATEVSLRNVELVEENARLQRKIDEKHKTKVVKNDK